MNMINIEGITYKVPASVKGKSSKLYLEDILTGNEMLRRLCTDYSSVESFYEYAIANGINDIDISIIEESVFGLYSNKEDYTFVILEEI